MRPNILFIFADQQRWDTCGCYGQELDTTPHLDAMAREGVRFENAFTCQPVCGPARACLQTGRYASEIGIMHNDIALPTDANTIARQLSAVGYQTGYVGKWHLASNYAFDWFPVPPGVERVNYACSWIPPERRGGYRDYWVAADILEFTSQGYGGYMWHGNGEKVTWDENTYRVDACTDCALDFLRTRDGTTPWFLFLSYIEPHHQNSIDACEGPHGCRERFADFEVPGDLQGQPGVYDKDYPDYLGAVNNIDTNLGRLREELKRQGMNQSTIIVYTADHGCHFKVYVPGNHKCDPHDSSTRIPMVIQGPGFSGGTCVDTPVSLIDLPTTLLQAAGVRPDSAMRGHDLGKLARGEASDHPGEAFIQISEAQCGRALRTADWLYAVRSPTADGRGVNTSDVYVEDLLYDIRNDPHQRTNLATDPRCAPIRAELAQRLMSWMREVGDGGDVRIEEGACDSGTD